MKPGCVVLIQARNTSTRLPGKATVDICGATPVDMLTRRIGMPYERWYTRFILPEEPESDAIARELVGWIQPSSIYFGPIDDVLRRRWEAVEQRPDWEYIALVGADDCMIGTEALDAAFSHAIYGRHEYVQTIGWPLGCNVQVVSRRLLEQANASAMRLDEREHITLFWDRRPEKYPRTVIQRPGASRHDVRLTLDTPADLELMRKIVADLGPLADVDDIVAWWDAHPDDQVHEPHFVPVGTPVPADDPLIRVGFDPSKGDL